MDKLTPERNYQALEKGYPRWRWKNKAALKYDCQIAKQSVSDGKMLSASADGMKAASQALDVIDHVGDFLEFVGKTGAADDLAEFGKTVKKSAVAKGAKIVKGFVIDRVLTATQSFSKNETMSWDGAISALDNRLKELGDKDGCKKE